MKLTHTKLLPELGVSHNPDIKKKVFLGRGEIPQLMNFGTATFKPGQAVEEHKHDTMFEVFYIQSGKAEFIVNGEALVLRAGDCITLEPGELHSQNNPFKEDVVWLYFGIATD
ncbi:quercetin dioxygenase-like cupin family protein [Saonia flava]|uniref:Quercetin dioxygenase-like cupin family protein n=1 Tax=Saonia flava TaxID=523696 RepID=A0A846QWN1_9FLAO|nr:cupin domain-containing protein [Saonia flava]NJB69995.1 quercetin dioxygenase-like cupin family protein [Saonia flava]